MDKTSWNLQWVPQVLYKYQNMNTKCSDIDPNWGGGGGGGDHHHTLVITVFKIVFVHCIRLPQNL